MSDLVGNPEDRFLYNEAHFITQLRRFCTGSRTTDYWIVSTDFASYSVVFGCQEQDSSGNCGVPLVWIWSRTPNKLSKAKTDKVDAVLDKLCVSNSTFLKTDQSNGIQLNLF